MPQHNAQNAAGRDNSMEGAPKHLTRIRRMFVFKGEEFYVYFRAWDENGSHIGRLYRIPGIMGK
jgi:hypothetical protein